MSVTESVAPEGLGIGSEKPRSNTERIIDELAGLNERLDFLETLSFYIICREYPSGLGSLPPMSIAFEKALTEKVKVVWARYGNGMTR